MILFPYIKNDEKWHYFIPEQSTFLGTPVTLQEKAM